MASSCSQFISGVDLHVVGMQAQRAGLAPNIVGLGQLDGLKLQRLKMPSEHAEGICYASPEGNNVGLGWGKV